MASRTENVAAILAERRRQVAAEGFDDVHDDLHADGAILVAGAHYLWAGTPRAAPRYPSGLPVGWPWEASWWKPRDRRSNLVRAGALSVAEIRRLRRAGLDDGAARRQLRAVLAEMRTLPASTVRLTA